MPYYPLMHKNVFIIANILNIPKKSRILTQNIEILYTYSTILTLRHIQNLPTRTIITHIFYIFVVGYEGREIS